MFLLVNLKTYEAGTGDGALEVAEAADRVAEETGVRVAVAPQAVDLRGVAKRCEAFGQHVDSVKFGSNTGASLAETVADAGATGTLINHSERRVRLHDLAGAIDAAERADLEALVCANDAEQCAAAAALEPDYVAVEPPELIGTGTPVSQADPDVVRDTVERVADVADVPVLCGAGITSGDDVRAAEELGAEGVLVASGVVKSDDSEEAMRELVT